MASALRASACVVLVGLVLIAREEIKHGNKRMLALMIVVVLLLHDLMVSLVCACLTSASATLDLEVLGVTRLCHSVVPMTAMIVASALRASAFVILVLLAKIAERESLVPEP